jgi:hypothetical protein
VYVNAKMMTIETLPVKAGWEIKKNGVGGELKYGIFDIL